MATTLSLVVIFLPVAFMTGYARRYINPFGWTMAFSILVSMLVSFTLTPMLSSRFLKVSDARGRPQDEGERLLPLAGQLVHAVGQLVARRTRGRSSASRSRSFLLTFPLNRMVGPDVRPQRGHGRVHGPPRHAGRHVARRDRARSPRSSCKELERHRGRRAHRSTDRRSNASRHIHLIGFLLPFDERKVTQEQVVARDAEDVSRRIPATSRP